MRLLRLLAGIWIAGGPALRGAERPVVLTTLFPLHDFTQQIAGEYAEVHMLLPPGAEAHTYAPTPGDMVRISKADLLLYLSAEMETWLPRLTATAPPSLQIRAVAPPQTASHIHLHDDACSSDHHSHDPHIWLDPLQAMGMAETIAAALAETDPSHAATYHARCAQLQLRLQELHVEIESGLAACSNRTIISGGHFAFGHFAQRYGLRHVSPYPGFSPNAQPSPRALTLLIRTTRELHARAIFHEEILDPKVARILAEETGLPLLPLHSLHNLTKDDLAAGATYFSLMRRNLHNLRQGLGCPP